MEIKTILIEVTDEEKFKKTWRKMCDAMVNEEPTDGYRIVGLSHEDEFAKVEANDL